MLTRLAPSTGVASSAGVPSAVWPSAATELQCTIRSAPARCAARITATVPSTLARSISAGFGTQNR